jgi:N,N'-diacetylbacillosaminyl-diphospho-undecaprenol alpha-1,3-N-acetylgalactosaminyltransferase
MVPHNRLLAEIKKADLAVSPALHEAQSMYALEAMACGKPIVAFDIPSMREIITDGVNGVLAKSFDTHDLSEKLQRLLCDEKMRLKIGQNAIKYVSQKHNEDRQVEQYIQIYSKLSN